MAIRYRLYVSTDNPDTGWKDDGDLIKGDVLAHAIRRVSGELGRDDGLIEVPLFGHRYRYEVRVDLSGPAPRLVELRMIAGDDGTDVDPTSVRDVPVRRLAKAAARFITFAETPIGPVVMVDELHNPTLLTRPDLEPPSRRKLDDVHYRDVAERLIWARESGAAPREYVADRLGASLPTVDRWIKEAKKRGYLRRDWATAADPTD